MERILVIPKPDCLQRRITGKVISRFERKVLKIVAVKMLKSDGNYSVVCGG
jgi:nucleoside-diphosphate kinase